MLKQFAHKIEEMRRLIDNSRSASSFMSSESRHIFLLAVSGGMDSMCMLDLFSKVLPVEEFAVAHCNFSLRGEESDGDQALVEQYAASLGVRIFVKRFDTVGYAREHGISIEMAARDLRYEWFGQLCQEHGFDVLAVAHNANDNAETLMLNLLRGTGLNGLHGMNAHSSAVITKKAEDPTWSNRRSRLSKAKESYNIFRPLLECTRKQIEGHVLANRVPYRHDSSNFESDYKRNKIRNEVFPVFEKINPSVVRTLNREIGYFTEAGSIVDEWCRSQLPSVLSDESRHLTIDIAVLMVIPQWRYLLYYILSPYGFNHQLLASIESLLTSSRTQSGKRFESDTHVLYTERESLVLTEKTDLRSPMDNALSQCDDIMVVRGAGVYNFNGRRFKVELVDRTPELSLKQPFGTLLFDADVMRFPFVCRRWRQGDWLIPFGMRGKKKVSDIFTDLKFSTADKTSAVILVDTSAPDFAEQQHVAALLGLRIDDRYKIATSTRSVLLIQELFT